MKVCIATGKSTGRSPQSEEVQRKAFSDTYRKFFFSSKDYYQKSHEVRKAAENTMGNLKKRNDFFIS